MDVRNDFVCSAGVAFDLVLVVVLFFSLVFEVENLCLRYDIVLLRGGGIDIIMGPDGIEVVGYVISGCISGFCDLLCDAELFTACEDGA